MARIVIEDLVVAVEMQPGAAGLSLLRGGYGRPLGASTTLGAGTTLG